jgi:hypothetical protein
MLSDLTPAQVLEGVNAGLLIKASNPTLAQMSMDAQSLFATGYADLRIKVGAAANKGFSEHDRRIIKAFSARLFAEGAPGALLNMTQGRDVRLIPAIDSRSMRTNANLLIAQIFSSGYNNRIKIAPSISLVGEKHLTHLEDGVSQYPLIEPLDPLAVVEAVVSLFYADLWQTASD